MEQKILNATEEIHNLNVFHGDVRPANILVAEDGNKVWIIDFEDGEIIAHGDEKREFYISDEMEEVHRILRVVKEGSTSDDCLPIPGSENSTPRVLSLRKC